MVLVSSLGAEVPFWASEFPVACSALSRELFQGLDPFWEGKSFNILSDPVGFATSLVRLANLTLIMWEVLAVSATQGATEPSPQSLLCW